MARKISRKKKIVSLGLVALLISLSGIAVTTSYGVWAAPGGGMMIDPGMFGMLIGNQFVGDLEGMDTMFQMLFANASDLSGFATVPHTYVFNTTGNESKSWGVEADAYYAQVFNTSSGLDPGVWASSHVTSSLTVSSNRTYLTVFILWDPDDSLVQFINLIGSAVETFGSGDMNAMIASITNLLGALMNFNTIFTGDEVFTLASFIVDNMTYSGSYDVDNTLYYSQDDGNPFDADSVIPTPASTDLGDPSNPMKFFTEDYEDQGAYIGNNVAYQMWMVQLHIRNLHVGIDFSELLGGSPESALNEIDIGFDIMTHRVTGLHVFDDDNNNGMLDLAWTYGGDWENDNLTDQSAQIDASETKFNYNIKNYADIAVVEPYVDGTTIAFGLNLTDVEGELVPFGTQQIFSSVNNASALPANVSETSHIVHFDPVVSGNPATSLTGSANLKIDHVIGNWTVNGEDEAAGIATELGIPESDMGLALSYSSLIFNFDFKLNTQANVSMDKFTVRDDSKILVDATHDNITGDQNNSAHIDGGLTIALGGTPITDIDLTGETYDIYDNNGVLANSSLKANASVLPLAQMVFNFGAQGITGENANATLGLNMNLDTFVYAVSYGDWNGSKIVHDPVFTVTTAIMPTFPTIAVVVLVIVIAVAALAIVIHKKKEY